MTNPMNHFFLSSEQIEGDSVNFPVDVAKQIRRVLRLRDGEHVMVLDNLGKQYMTRIQFDDERNVMGIVDDVQDATGESAIESWLYLSLSQREKMEWVLQKGTELGMAGIVPVISERSLVQDRQIVSKKRERWERILKEAAEQSHRGRIPVLKDALSFSNALQDAKSQTALVMIPSVGEDARSFRNVLDGCNAKSIAVFIGPEGGYSENEIGEAEQLGVLPVSLGPRVLRMETAAMSVIALIQYHFGQLD